MKLLTNDEKFSTQIQGVLPYHRKMLADGVRNKLLYEAIKKNINSETNFLDVGAGTGIWAILAAKLGAKRVVAVEIEESLIPIMFRHAQENGVADKVEIIHAHSNDFKIRGKFNLIVSEIFGVDAFGEATVSAFVKLRNRFLASNGILIPQKMIMFAIPVRVENSIQDLPAGLPIKCDFFKSLSYNYPQTYSLSERQRVKFLAEPQELIEIDFRTVESNPCLQNLSLSWQLDNISEVNAFATFTHSFFTDEIKMDAFDSQSWNTTIYEFQPFQFAAGKIKFDLSLAQKKENWSVSLSSNPEIKPQNYSPVFAFARVRMAQQITPHIKFPNKKEL